MHFKESKRDKSEKGLKEKYSKVVFVSSKYWKISIEWKIERQTDHQVDDAWLMFFYACLGSGCYSRVKHFLSPEKCFEFIESFS